MIRRHLVAAGVLAAACGVGALLVAGRDESVPARPVPALPAVEVVVVAAEDVRLDVRAHGLVEPATSTTLHAEVAGTVVSVAEDFAAGGFFEDGSVLVRLDGRDLEVAVLAAETEVARAETLLAQEEASARLAADEWDALGEDGEPDPLLLRVPQLREARARAESARGAAFRARLDVERATVRAPFAGRIRETLVERGQYVPVGTALARIDSVDAAEVRLPVRDEELRFLDLPLAFRGEPAPTSLPAAVVRADFAGAAWAWDGAVVRTEGQIDPLTRALTVVVSVPDPYGRAAASDRPPLVAGLFVEATLAGRTAQGVIVVPRAAAREGDRVWVVDDDDRLVLRAVRWLRAERERMVVAEGLRPGERVVVSSLDLVSDGMPVRVVPRAADEDGP